MKLRLTSPSAPFCCLLQTLCSAKTSTAPATGSSSGRSASSPSGVHQKSHSCSSARLRSTICNEKEHHGFIVFAAICLAFLFLMRDFGTALIFFACFLIIAFMRSALRTHIFLILAAACFGVFLILQFKPYVAQRFSGWMRVGTQDSLGYQQVRTMTYIASGGLFGLGLGNGILKICRRRQRSRVRYAVRGAGALLMGMAVLFALVLFYPLRPQRCHTPVAPFYAIAAMRRLEHAALFRPRSMSSAPRMFCRSPAASRCRSSRRRLSMMSLSLGASDIPQASR